VVEQKGHLELLHLQEREEVVGLEHYQSEGVQSEERQDFGEYDAAQGYPGCDCCICSVLWLHGHVEGCLEVFDP
jgi:hypothetical protein